MTSAALYICYLGVADPLVHSQVIAYLRELVARGKEIHLLTFEPDALTAAQRERIAADLDADGIRWHSLRYHRSPSLPATAYDIVIGTLKALNICARHGIRIVHARSHVAAAIALWVKWLRGAKVLFDVRGLLADEYADVGHWRRGGLKYRLTKAMERLLFKEADALVVLTRIVKADLLATEPSLRGRGEDIQVIPCCAATERFSLDSTRRELYRRDRGWAGKRVLVSAGKLGTWYLATEMARFVAVARLEDARFFLQVLTQSDPSALASALAAAGVPADAYDIRSVAPAEVPGILSAADAGISFIRPCYSKRSSSPTRVAEYLAAGLPVISTAGIGDCDEILMQPNLGVVIERLEDGEYRHAARTLIHLLDDPETPALCRDFAEREVSVSRIGGPRYASVYDRLLGRVAVSDMAGVVHS